MVIEAALDKVVGGQLSSKTSATLPPQASPPQTPPTTKVRLSNEWLNVQGEDECLLRTTTTVHTI